jgi:hypothetical protein
VSYFAQTSHTDNGETYSKMPAGIFARGLMIAVASAAIFTLSTTAFAQGTAAEAKAMLEKAAAAVKTDKATAPSLLLAAVIQLQGKCLARMSEP